MVYLTWVCILDYKELQPILLSVQLYGAVFWPCRELLSVPLVDT